MTSQVLVPEYKSRLSAFFSEYVEPKSENAYDSDGLLNMETMQAAVDLLLDSGIFKSPEALIKAALKSHSVMIHGDMIPAKYYNRGRRP